MKLKWLILIQFLVFILFGCEALFKPELSPPSWIIGTWRDEFGINTYTFTPDNMIFTTSYMSINFKEAYTSNNISDDSTSTSYAVYTTDPDGTKGTYRFVKVTDTTLNYSITSEGVTIGPIILFKQ